MCGGRFSEVTHPYTYIPYTLIRCALYGCGCEGSECTYIKHNFLFILNYFILFLLAFIFYIIIVAF